MKINYILDISIRISLIECYNVNQPHEALAQGAATAGAAAMVDAEGNVDGATAGAAGTDIVVFVCHLLNQSSLGRFEVNCFCP